MPFTLASKNLNLSRIRVFRWKLLGNFPKHSKKTPNEKPTSAAWFFKTPLKFHCFFANVNARSNLAGIILVFGHVVRDLQRNHPTAARGRNAHYTCTVKGREKSRMRTTYQNTSMRFGFFAHALFVPKTPNAIGFSGSVNGTTKHPGFFGFWFLPM